MTSGTHPSFATYWHENDTDHLQVRLTYSNAALLEKLNVQVVEDHPPEVRVVPTTNPDAEVVEDPAGSSPFGTLQLTDDGAWLMPYELLINPPALESKALHWPWVDVKKHLDQLESLGESYRGRRLYLLDNPLTGRPNGTTRNFFATITIRPPGIVDRPTVIFPPPSTTTSTVRGGRLWPERSTSGKPAI
jgi:gentisate 1,2-dioxygenase